jgi:hypothetical protein
MKILYIIQIENGYMNGTELACDTVHWWIMSTPKENLVFVATRNSVSGQKTYQLLWDWFYGRVKFVVLEKIQAYLRMML